MHKNIPTVDVIAMPHAIVIMDGDRVQSLMIVICEGLAFQIPSIEDVPTAFLLLISCYYSLDLDYFTAFGLLKVVDKFVFHPGQGKGPSPKRPKQKKGGRKKKEPECLLQFFSKFEDFLAQERASV